jgi:hypothetical protein
MTLTGKTIRWLTVIGALIAALYGQFLHNPIVFDDQYAFLLDKDGHSAIDNFANPGLLDLRALPYATLAWSARFFGLDLAHFRIENLLLHWGVVIVMALFVLRLYRMVLPDAKPSENTGIAASVLIIACMFALHPVAIYAAGYLVQRSIVMATLFCILSLWANMHGNENRSRIWLWASVALYFMATHSKEHVVMLPFAVLAMTILLHEDWRDRLRQSWPVFLGYAAVGLFTLYQIRSAVGVSYEIYSSEMLESVTSEHAHAYSVLTQSALFFKYGVLWLLPNPSWMSVDMRETFAQSVLSVYGLALVAYLAYGFFAFNLLIKRNKKGLIGFAMLFPWLMFMTEFSTVRIQEIFVLYRSYIWALGGVMVLPLLLMKFNARLTLMLSVLFAATLFMVSMERLSSFSHPILLWDDAQKLVVNRLSLPGVGRIYYNRGNAYLKVNMVEAAIPDFLQAAKLNPGWSVIFGNLGVAYSKIDKNELAIQAFSRAIQIDQDQKVAPSYNYYAGRAIAYEANGDWLKAAVDYKVTCLLANKGCDKNTLAAPLLLK